MLVDDRNQKRQPQPFLWFFAAIGALALIAVVLLVVAVVMVGSWVAGRGSMMTRYDNLDHNGKIVAGIRIEGEVEPLLADEILDRLDEASEDKDVVGVLLDVNSPGGSVVASQEIYDAVARLRETMPVVAYVREMAASGAYYSCASASKIVANRGSMVGSIGVVMSAMGTSELMKWMKLTPLTLKSGALKDAGNTTREWTDAERVYLQKLIDDTRVQFSEDVRSKRKLSDDAVAHMSDGRVVLGTEALALNLVDALGSRQDAVEAVAKLAGVKEVPELMYYEKEPGFRDVLRQFLEEEAIARPIREGIRKTVVETLSDGFALKRN
jgi:protease-4